MPASTNQLYQAHVKNLRAVDVAFERVSRELNSSLSRSDDKTADALLKTAMLLLGGWARARPSAHPPGPGGCRPGRPRAG